MLAGAQHKICGKESLCMWLVIVLIIVLQNYPLYSSPYFPLKYFIFPPLICPFEFSSAHLYKISETIHEIHSISRQYFISLLPYRL